jgi:hypothetical protein
MTINVKKEKVISNTVKLEILNKNKEKAIKTIKSKKPQRPVLKFIKKNALRGLNKDLSEITYLQAFSIIVIISDEYDKIKQLMTDNKEMYTKRFKDETYWNSPSKNDYVYFLYTYLYELYEHYLPDHVNYFMKLNEKEMLDNLKEY